LPTYEYACTACGHRLEAVQKFTDDALTECPECGGKLRKVFGAWASSSRAAASTRPTRGRRTSGPAPEKSAGSNGSDSVGSDTKTDSVTTGSTDSGPRRNPRSPAPSGDKPVKESKPAASAAT
jgi:putative FmdB family regulatory protein